MSDITALALRMKAAAKQSAFSSRHSVGMEVAADSFDFIELTTPANVLALVEALEKAQSANTAQDDHINQQQDQIDTLEKRNAELGREVIHLQSLKTVNAARQEAESEFHRGYSCGHKDASLESRTVTVKLPKKFTTSMYGIPLYEQCDVLEMLRAAGIQVIEGEQKNG